MAELARLDEPVPPIQNFRALASLVYQSLKRKKKKRGGLNNRRLASQLASCFDITVVIPARSTD